MSEPLLEARHFAERRQQLMSLMAPGSIAIVSAASHQTRSRDTEYIFRQHSDFHYLSGFEEADAVLVLIPGRKDGKFIMFCQPKDKDKELWEGRRLGPADARKTLGADEAHSITDIDKVLPKLCSGCDTIYYNLGEDDSFDGKILSLINSIKAQVRAGLNAPNNVSDLSQLLHEMRLKKSEVEIETLAQAARIGARAHVRAMQYCKPAIWEYQLEAEILHEFAHAGARAPAYNSIVGGGDNACILHYTDNNQRLQDGDLVLIDAGCEWHYYATDITRTFPVNGKFNDAQRALYELVLKAQLAAINDIRPGNTWNMPNDTAVKVLTAGLVELGLLRGDLDQLINNEAYKDFYMHRVGHWLGMDVHDVGSYKKAGEWRKLKPGMVMTVEPGLYVSPDNKNVDAKWRGIGIRIEDVVVVTEEGCRILTSDAPKTCDEIERLMA